MINRNFNPGLLLKLLMAVLVAVSLWIIIDKGGRNQLFAYFSIKCLDYRQKDFSRKLNDRIVDYSFEAKRKGIKVCKDNNELRKSISEGNLVRIRSGRKYLVDRMTYSYPCITKESKVLLDEISRRFREKTSQKGLRGSRFSITSMTRRSDDMKGIRMNNKNSSANSPHLYGIAFDISYKRFSVRKMFLTNCDKKFLKDALSEVIWQLREEGRCWATYERMQNCYHVVSR
jgi:hypothetical protein